MTDRALSDFRGVLDELAALKPWANAADPASQPFVEAFAAARERALAAAPAYVEAAGASQEGSLTVWLADMTALKAWADVGNPEQAPFVEAFAAAREKALEAISETPPPAPPRKAAACGEGRRSG